MSKNYVNALRARIRDLENIIERQGGSAHLDGMDLGGDSDSADEGDAGAAEEISQALGNLLVSRTYPKSTSHAAVQRWR